jgi:hypothetical protein
MCRVDLPVAAKSSAERSRHELRVPESGPDVPIAKRLVRDDQRAHGADEGERASAGIATAIGMRASRTTAPIVRRRIAMSDSPRAIRMIRA